MKSLVEKAVLTLQISQLRNTEGIVQFAMFASTEAAAFPRDVSRAIKTGSFAIPDHSFRITFDDLPFGCYAATVFHDENSNGNFDIGLFGIPQEGFGFSRNPRVWKGAPRFQDAAFDFRSNTEVIEIVMKYF